MQFRTNICKIHGEVSIQFGVTEFARRSFQNPHGPFVSVRLNCPPASCDHVDDCRMTTVLGCKHVSIDGWVSHNITV